MSRRQGPPCRSWCQAPPGAGAAAAPGGCGGPVSSADHARTGIAIAAAANRPAPARIGFLTLVPPVGPPHRAAAISAKNMQRPATASPEPQAKSLTGIAARAMMAQRSAAEETMPEIDGARLLADLRRLAQFGRYETGVHRPTYSPEDVAARHWLAARFAEAGLLPVIDGIGNVIGRDMRARRRLLVGSHAESQPRGGWLDGALGVVYALELARAFAADPDCTGLGIETVAWSDEEGHFGNMLGSRSFTGRLTDEEIAAAKSRDGVPLTQALHQAGYAGRPRVQLDPDRYVGYLEAHIEQGDWLESRGLKI